MVTDPQTVAGGSIADDGVDDCPSSSTGRPGKRSMEIDRKGILVNSKSRRPNSNKTSNYIGVTKHRWSGKFEGHLWDGAYQLEGQKRKGRQVYLGSYESEEKAARAYDVAALKYWGPVPGTKLNFAVSDYEKEIEEMRNMSQEECVASLRRKSSCFSRGASTYRGVTRRQKDGRWQARIGHIAGRRDFYLGTFTSEKEAAEAYDIAAVRLLGVHAITNFDIRNYLDTGPEGLEKV